MTCAVDGYTGTDGECTCAPGFTGTVSYILGQPSGCLQCAPGKTTITDGGACTNISCANADGSTIPGYAGSAGNCRCASGYAGQVTYAVDGILYGCDECDADHFSVGGNNTSCSSCPDGTVGSGIVCVSTWTDAWVFPAVTIKRASIHPRLGRATHAHATMAILMMRLSTARRTVKLTSMSVIQPCPDNASCWDVPAPGTGYTCTQRWIRP